jgi:hypothetical protein
VQQDSNNICRWLVQFFQKVQWNLQKRNEIRNYRKPTRFEVTKLEKKNEIAKIAPFTCYKFAAPVERIVFCTKWRCEVYYVNCTLCNVEILKIIDISVIFELSVYRVFRNSRPVSKGRYFSWKMKLCKCSGNIRKVRSFWGRGW